MKKYNNLVLIFFFIFLEIFFLFNPKIIITSFTKTTNICLYTLLPTMFISTLFSQILINLKIHKYIPNFIKRFITKILNISDHDFSIIILSMISGFPNNANLLLNNPNLNNIINYTSFVNPIFLICTTGFIYLKDIKLSLIILTSHYISNFIIGLLFRNSNAPSNNENSTSNKNFLEIYYNAIRNTTITISLIFSNILFFSFIISIIKLFIDINPIFNSLIYGLLEFSNGIYNITYFTNNKFIQGLIIIIIISFSSFSIHMQMISINKKIRYIKYLKYRFINIIISCVVFIILFNLLL